LPAEPKTNNWRKSIREREQAEKKRLEKWRKEFKKMRDHAKTELDTEHYFSHVVGASTNQWTYTYPTSIDNITIADHTTPNTTLRVDGTIEVQGRDILKELDEMRDALLLLKRDVDMEAKYPKLKKLKDEYERALEKYKTFEALK
jgi:hemerythrin superfamily protein